MCRVRCTTRRGHFTESSALCLSCSKRTLHHLHQIQQEQKLAQPIRIQFSMAWTTMQARSVNLFRQSLAAALPTWTNRKNGPKMLGPYRIRSQSLMPSKSGYKVYPSQFLRLVKAISERTRLVP